MREFLSEAARRWVLPFAKAWAVAGVAAAFRVLSTWGLEVPEDVQAEVFVAVELFILWLVPNVPFAKKK